jgi:hypothetical protein
MVSYGEVSIARGLWTPSSEMRIEIHLKRSETPTGGDEAGVIMRSTAHQPEEITNIHPGVSGVVNVEEECER